MIKILCLGASGLLGTHLVPLLKQNFEVLTPSHSQYDVTEKNEKIECDLVLNLVAYTNVAKAEIEREECFKINVMGALRLSDTYFDKPLIHLSTEYAHKPVNWYGRTKQIAEAIITEHPSYLIIRTLFKPDIWPYDNAFINQFTLGDTVSVIAPKIAALINEWDKKSKLVYCGTGRKTIYDIAIKSKPGVRKSLTGEIRTVKIPNDYK